MNLKSNKGYVGVDITIAVLILLILVPTIMGIVYNINLSKHSVKVKTQGLDIAVNTIEIAKGISLEALNEQQLLSAINSSNLYTMTIDNSTNSAIIQSNIATYVLEVDIVDYHEINQDAIENIVKTIGVKVSFKTGNQEQHIELKSVLK